MLFLTRRLRQECAQLQASSAEYEKSTKKEISQLISKLNKLSNDLKKKETQSMGQMRPSKAERQSDEEEKFVGEEVATDSKLRSLNFQPAANNASVMHQGGELGRCTEVASRKVDSKIELNGAWGVYAAYVNGKYIQGGEFQGGEHIYVKENDSHITAKYCLGRMRWYSSTTFLVLMT